VLKLDKLDVFNPVGVLQVWALTLPGFMMNARKNNILMPNSF